MLKVKTQSFAAVGWKPNDVTRSCQNFPKLSEYGGGGHPEAEAESEAEAEAESEAESEAEPECGFSEENTFTHPEGCAEEECDYVAKWARHGDFVKFRVIHRDPIQ